MRDPDVLVVGGGLGGCIAALAAADADPGATVRLVAPREHAFDDSTGLIDVLGYVGGRTEPVVEPLSAMYSLPSDHPYSILGESALRDGLARFDSATAGSYAGSEQDANALLPTLVGGARPAARYPAAVEPGLLSEPEPTVLVGFESLPDFDAQHAAARLEAMDVPFSVRASILSAAVDVDEAAPALSIARALDANEAVGIDVPLRESVGRGLRARIGNAETRIGVPAVLGLEEPAPIHAALAAEVDADVFEIPLGSPSVLGRRLEATLMDALAAAGVRVDRPWDVEAFERAGGRISAVTVAGDGERETLSPGAVVLATGGPAGGGLVADREAVREPRFGCHVPHPDDRQAWAAPSALGDHPLAAFGVRIDDHSRPQTEGDEPVASNLYAAGRLVGGRNFIAEHSVGGIALATGAVAGERAANDH